MLWLICSINFISNVHLGLISCKDYNYIGEFNKSPASSWIPPLKVRVKKIDAVFKYF